MPAEKSIALISGSETGIGASLVCKLVQEGFDVIMACKDVEAGRRTAGSVTGNFPGRVLRILPLDLTDPQSIHGLAHTVHQEMDQQINVLVDSAAVFIDDWTAEVYNLSLRPNFKSNLL
ncbi:hypothetical protein DUNSADRAFT_17243 [Dunaliella salina]|uniref:Uncharacterized protein n=1 Tax=Dunaliella salina TaxID=3046 RepID=A0ABQ7H099_DUNSA|nr:hypothetical protein DUNSADRAFT_17243 [Dunaliella salina]|eukprot:KAF5840274.1 hypothetical protein DUNSADRAFT_17243 [Dunaliella salina]